MKKVIFAAIVGLTVAGSAHAGVLGPMSSNIDSTRLGYVSGSLKSVGSSVSQKGFELDGGRVFAGGYALYDGDVRYISGGGAKDLSGRIELGLGVGLGKHIAVAPIVAGQYGVIGLPGSSDSDIVFEGGAGAKVIGTFGPVIVTLSDIEGHVGKAIAGSNGQALNGGNWTRESARVAYQFSRFAGLYVKYSRQKFALAGAEFTNPTVAVGIRLR